MKKIVLIFVAMMAMVQMNTAAAAEAPADGEENNMTYDHPFKSEDAKSHWAVTTNGFYFGMGLKHNWETINNSFEIGLLNIAAVHHRSYSMKRPTMLMREDVADAVIVGTYPKADDNIKNRSSNLNMWTVQFPLVFTQRIAGKLNISLAGILNWNAYARVDNHYELNKIEHDTKFKGLKQQKIGFDAMGALTWNKLGIYCRYTPGKFFKDGYGPEIKNTWTMGLTIGL